jgi:chromosome segregation ATPase
MAFSRDELRAIGIDGEALDKVMTLHGQTVQETRSEVEAAASKIAELEDQVKTGKAEVDSLNASLTGSQDLAVKLEDLQKKYDADTAKLSQEVVNIRRDSLVTQSISKTNARDPQDLRAFLDMDAVQIGEDGTLVGLDDQLAKLQEDKAYLFDKGAATSYNPQGGGSVAPVTLDAALKGEGNLTEYLKKHKESN